MKLRYNTSMAKKDYQPDEYERALERARLLGLNVHEREPFKSRLLGLTIDNDIYLSDRLTTRGGKRRILEEEIAHYELTVGDTLDLRKTDARRSETRAHRRVVKRLVPLNVLCEVIQYLKEETSIYSIARELDLPEDLIREAIEYYAIA